MTTAYLGKLDPETTKEEIKQFMEAAGKVFVFDSTHTHFA